MEKYDKIYIPCDENDSALYAAWGEEEADYVGAIREKENVIVLTIEELRDVWDAGWKRCAFETSENSALFPDFEPYITSKGITL
jgi:hypothetical protein